MNNRIKLIRENENMTQDEFGKRLGVTRQSISRLEKGERNLTNQMMLSICKEYGINESWLKTGEGDMYLATDIAYNMGAFLTSAPPEHQELINAIMKLSDQTKNELIEMMRNIINNIDN